MFVIVYRIMFYRNHHIAGDDLRCRLTDAFTDAFPWFQWVNSLWTDGNENEKNIFFVGPDPGDEWREA